MVKKSDSYSMEDAVRLANSPAGQQLLSILKQADSDVINLAMEQAIHGNVAQAKETLRKIAASEDVKRILRQMEE